MRNYESTIIINGTLEDEPINQTVNRTVEFITRNGGTVENTNHWGRRRLAYAIDRKTSGYYVQFMIKGEPELAVQLERFYFLEEQIIRSLTLQMDEKTLRKRAETKERMAEIAAEEAARAAEAAASQE